MKRRYRRLAAGVAVAHHRVGEQPRQAFGGAVAGHLPVGLPGPGLGLDPLADGRRIDHASRAVAAYLARRRFGYLAGEIARALGYRRHTSVNWAVQRVEFATAKLAKTARLLEEQLCQRLKLVGSRFLPAGSAYLLPYERTPACRHR